MGDVLAHAALGLDGERHRDPDFRHDAVSSVGDLMRRGRATRDAAFAKADAARRAEVEQLRALPRGPRLLEHQRYNAREYVTGVDLDDVVPDGWFLAHETEFQQAGERHELPPRAVALMTIFAVVHGLKGSDYGNGCGLQAPAEWYARKLSCSVRWVHRLFNLLDPSAAWRRQERRRRMRQPKETREQWKARMRTYKPTARPGGDHYLDHFQQLRRYGRVARNGFSAWLDTKDRVHSWVDVQPVTYLRPLGVRLVAQLGLTRRRVHLRGHGRVHVAARCGAVAGLYRRWARKDAVVRRRLSPRGGEFTPSNVMIEEEYIYSVRRSPSEGVTSGTDPPGWGRSGHGPGAEATKRRQAEPSFAALSAQSGVLPGKGAARVGGGTGDPWQLLREVVAAARAARDPKR